MVLGGSMGLVISAVMGRVPVRVPLKGSTGGV